MTDYTTGIIVWDYDASTIGPVLSGLGVLNYQGQQYNIYVTGFEVGFEATAATLIRYAGSPEELTGSSFNASFSTFLGLGVSLGSNGKVAGLGQLFSWGASLSYNWTTIISTNPPVLTPLPPNAPISDLTPNASTSEFVAPSTLLNPTGFGGTVLEGFIPSSEWPESFDWNFTDVHFGEVEVEIPDIGGAVQTFSMPGILVSSTDGNFTGALTETPDGVPVFQIAAGSYGITQTAIATAGGGLAVITDNGSVTGQFNYTGSIAADAALFSYIGAGNLVLESATFTDNASGETVAEAVTVGGSGVVGDALVTKIKAADGTWQTTVTVHEDLPGLTAAQEAALQLAAFNAHTLVGGQIGTIFGSALSQAIPTDNIFEQVAAGSILAAIGHNLGQAIDAGLSTTLSMTDIAEQALAGSIGAANDNTAWSQMRAVA